jgi:hypothetical protein
MKRVLKTVVTFDYVIEPGIAVAEKFKSPALEDFSEDVMFTRGQIRRGVMSNSDNLVTQESVSLSASELFQTMGWQTDQETINAFSKAPAWKGW